MDNYKWTEIPGLKGYHVKDFTSDEDGNVFAIVTGKNN